MAEDGRDLLLTDVDGNEYVSVRPDDFRPWVVFTFCIWSSHQSLQIEHHQVAVQEVLPPNSGEPGFRVRIRFLNTAGREQIIRCRTDGECADPACFLAIRRDWIRQEPLPRPTRSRVVTQVEAEE